MVVWSSLGSNKIAKANLLRSLLFGSKNAPKLRGTTYMQVRNSSDREIIIRTSVYQYVKFKDLLNFYVLLAVIPIGLLVLYTNIFIGPAKLALIPEGYEPKHWEYHKHPITRFLAKYIVPSPQEQYERTVHNIFVMGEKRQLGKLETKIRNLIKERQDYQAWYYMKPELKYPRTTLEHFKKADFEERGKGPGVIR